MKKVLGVLLVLCLLAATPLLLPACQEKEEAPEGQLPTYKVGDEWVWSYVMNGITYTLTEEVIEEETVGGRACYVVDMSFDPVISYTQDDVVSTITSHKYWMDKATGLLGVKSESSGTYNGTAFTRTMTYSYNPWASLFPLELGKEAETECTTTQYFDGSQAGDPTVTTEKYKVDSKVDATITAGTFSCWKIIIYDGADNVITTTWYSDQAKSMVKTTDADGNTTMELISYSVK